MYKKKELQLSYFSICEGKKLDDKIVTYFALKAGSTVCIYEYVDIFSCVDTRGRDWLCPGLKGMHIYLSIHFFLFEHTTFFSKLSLTDYHFAVLHFPRT